MTSRKIFLNFWLVLGLSIILLLGLVYATITGAKVMFFQGAAFQLRVAGAVLIVVALTLVVRVFDMIGQAIYAIPEGLSQAGV